jgi:hypothetical protein
VATPRISFFNLGPADIRATPSLGAELRAAGITTLEMQVYRSPANDPDYPTWERNWEAEKGKEIDWCAREGWDYVGRFDDGFRTPPEREAMGMMPKSITHVASRTEFSARCVGIEVCDEMDHDPYQYPVYELVDLWNEVVGPPIAFPGWAPQRYERLPGAAAYCSRQWPWWSATTHKTRFQAMRDALKELPPDNRRVCLMIPVVGAWYSERDGKPGLSPGDVTWNKGMTPKGIREMMIAARRIVAPRPIQFRLYGYDGPLWVRERAEAQVGHRGRLQRGVSRALDPKRWYAVLGVCKEMAG